MTGMKKFISYDLGTGGVKASLFDEQLGVLANSFIEYGTKYTGGNFHEQAPEDWWNGVAKSTRKLLEETGTDPAEIVSLALSGHSLVTVPMDKDGNIFIKGRSKSMILTANGQNIYPEEVEAIINDQPYVGESVVVDRASRLVALVYFDQDAIKRDGLDTEAVADLPERVRINSNKKLPSYSQITKVEVQESPFEKTPKMSIKRLLYK